MQTSFSFEAIGTHWKIDCYGQLTLQAKEKLLGEIKTLIKRFDMHYSRFKSESLVSQIARKKGTYKMPDTFFYMMDFYEKLYKLTSGSVTPLIGSVMVESGYDAKYSLMPKTLHHPYKWEEVIDYDKSKLIVKKPVLLDFGAAGKGYLIDLVAKILIKNKIENYCIDAGGDILYKNSKKKKLRVGLEHPDNTSQVIGVTEILNESICGSAGNRRRWGKFNHIINPHTLKPAYAIKSVWVVAKEAMIADGIATGLFFVKPERLKDEFEFEYFILYKDLSFLKSDGFLGDVFTR